MHPLFQRRWLRHSGIIPLPLKPVPPFLEKKCPNVLCTNQIGQTFALCCLRAAVLGIIFHHAPLLAPTRCS
jgi:hypothetical protein